MPVRHGRWLGLSCWGVACAVLLVSLDGRAGATFGLLATTGIAFAAAGAAGHAAWRLRGDGRRAWALLGLGCFGWGAGNLYWTWNELVRRSEVLFPSPADAGYLLFPVAAAVGLAYLQGRTTVEMRLASALDGLIVTLSLLVISWVAALGPAYRAGADSTLAFGIALAYPLSDVLLVTMVFLLAPRASAGSMRVLRPLLVAVLAMVTSDTAFAILSARGSYVSGDLPDLGWLVAFAALLVAARATEPADEVAVPRAELMPRWRLLLPYLPFSAAVAVTAWHAATGARIDRMQITAHLLLFALVLIRQLVTLLHNSTLSERLQHQAFHDPLTGLANRALFADRLSHAVALQERDGRALAVLFLDLDDFKLVNDTLGHSAGDNLLHAVGERLRACARPADTVARLGGDEFALLLEHGANPEAVAQRILDALRVPFVIGARQVTATGSIGLVVADPATRPADMAGGTVPGVTIAGVTVAGEQEDGATRLLRDVDLAMYAAKDRGKGTYAVFEPRMRQHVDEEVALRAELATALAGAELQVAYQPIVDLRGGRAVGVEALARWHHPERGEIPPSAFIGVAERAGLISALGAAVLDEACREFVSLNRGDLYLSVNISPSQLADAGFPDSVAATLARHRLAPQRLVLEMTEDVLADGSGVVTALSRLRALGLRVAVDDFGTGYASLRYLHRLPLDLLKIDRSYVQELAPDTDVSRLVATILQLSASMGLTVVAEGVEHPDQRAQLLELGCGYGQGYLFAAPVGAEALVSWLGVHGGPHEVASPHAMPAAAILPDAMPPVAVPAQPHRGD